MVQFHAVQVDRHFDFFYFLKRVQVNHRNRIVVVGDPVTSGVGDIEFVADDDHFFGLVADHTSFEHGQRGRIHFGHIPQPGVGVDLYRARVRTDIGIRAFKSEVTAVRDRDHSDMPGGTDIHHFDEVGTVDNRIELIAVYLNVVAHVAQLFNHAGIAFRINILGIHAGFGVIIIQRGFIAPHIAFVEQEKAFDRTFLTRSAGPGRSTSRIRIRGREDRLVFSARTEAEKERQ